MAVRKKTGRGRLRSRNMKNGLLSRTRYFFLIVLPVIALVVLVYFVSLTVKSSFVVKDIIFTGNIHLTDNELMNLAGIKRGESMIMSSSPVIYKRLMKSPWIRSVSIRKEFPKRLRIHIKESEPFALLDLKGRLFIVDDKGNMLQELKESPVPFLPIITGTPFGKHEALSEALNLARVIKDKGIVFEKDHVEIIAGKPQEMAVNLDGVVIKVGKGDYESKLLRLLDMEDEISKKKLHVDYIDLRFANRVVVKPMSEVIN